MVKAEIDLVTSIFNAEMDSLTSQLFNETVERKIIILENWKLELQLQYYQNILNHEAEANNKRTIQQIINSLKPETNFKPYSIN